MTRKEKIDLIIEAIWDFEGQELDYNDFEQYSDEQIDKEYNTLLD